MEITIVDKKKRLSKTLLGHFKENIGVACTLLEAKGFGFLCDEQRIRIEKNPYPHKPTTNAMFVRKSGDMVFFLPDLRTKKGKKTAKRRFKSSRAIRTFIHEMGHKLEWQYPHLLNKKERTKLYERGKKRKVEGLLVSNYGKTSPKEMMAESFAHWIAPELFTVKKKSPRVDVGTAATLLGQYVVLLHEELPPSPGYWKR